MHVQFFRSGGVAGMTLRAEVDAAELSADEAAGLDGLGSVREPAEAPGRDRFTYRFVVTDGERRDEYSFSEAAHVPDAVRSLLERMTRAAQGQGGARGPEGQPESRNL